MYMWKYENGNEVVWGKDSLVPDEVRDRNGNVVFTGREIDCVKYLAVRGDRVAIRALAARKDK